MKEREKGSQKKSILCCFLCISFLGKSAKSASQVPSMILTKALLEDYLRVELFTQPKYELAGTSISITNVNS